MAVAVYRYIRLPPYLMGFVLPVLNYTLKTHFTAKTHFYWVGTGFSHDFRGGLKKGCKYPRDPPSLLWRECTFPVSVWPASSRGPVIFEVGGVGGCIKYRGGFWGVFGVYNGDLEGGLNSYFT